MEESLFSPSGERFRGEIIQPFCCEEIQDKAGSVTGKVALSVSGKPNSYWLGTDKQQDLWSHRMILGALMRGVRLTLDANLPTLLP